MTSAQKSSLPPPTTLTNHHPLLPNRTTSCVLLGITYFSSRFHYLKHAFPASLVFPPFLNLLLLKSQSLCLFVGPASFAQRPVCSVHPRCGWSPPESGCAELGGQSAPPFSCRPSVMDGQTFGLRPELGCWEQGRSERGRLLPWGARACIPAECLLNQPRTPRCFITSNIRRELLIWQCVF